MLDCDLRHPGHDPEEQRRRGFLERRAQEGDPRHGPERGADGHADAVPGRLGPGGSERGLHEDDHDEEREREAARKTGLGRHLQERISGVHGLVTEREGGARDPGPGDLQKGVPESAGAHAQRVPLDQHPCPG